MPETGKGAQMMHGHIEAHFWQSHYWRGAYDDYVYFAANDDELLTFWEYVEALR